MLYSFVIAAHATQELWIKNMQLVDQLQPLLSAAMDAVAAVTSLPVLKSGMNVEWEAGLAQAIRASARVLQPRKGKRATLGPAESWPIITQQFSDLPTW